jgi:putative nucleotidyltransferase with HDIG domain
MQTLDNYIDKIKSLPPAPRVLSQLIVLLHDTNARADQIVELISFDPALTAKVLRRCNNAASGRLVADLDDAVTQIGFNAIYRMVAMVVGEGLLGGEQCGYGIGRGELWEHSVTTALAARVVAHRTNGEDNLAFTAGLLHDIGKLVLGTFLEGAEESIAQQTGPSGLSFLEAEKAILAVEHAEIGGRVLNRWNFPENLCSAVWHHHNPLQAGSHQKLAACVHLGDIIAHCLGQAQGYESFAVRTDASVMEILQVSPGDIDIFIIETEAALEQFNGLIQKT